MSTAIYKKGQGYWTRQMSTIAGGVMILLGAMWISDFFKNTDWFDLDPVYFRAASGVLWVAIFGSLLYYFIWLKPRSVDFLVATESEMKKVNWSSRRESGGIDDRGHRLVGRHRRFLQGLGPGLRHVLQCHQGARYPHLTASLPSVRWSVGNEENA